MSQPRIVSKLPKVGTTIFTVMSRLAQQHGAINLSQGFPNYSAPSRLNELVMHYMERGYNQYAPMPGVPLLRERMADKLARLYGASIDPEKEITITAGATQAIYTIVSAFVHPGDEVILIEPAFDCYRPAVAVNGGVPVIYECRPPDYAIDWAALGELISPATRMIIINSPNNPTGKTLKAEDMAQLQRLVKGTDIIVLSDEVYEHLIFDGQEHQSMLRYLELWARSFAVFSFGKTFHNTGWKVGCCVGPDHLMREFRKVHQFNVFSVNTPVQHALADYLADEDTYLSLPSFYQQKRDCLLTALEGTPLKALPCEGTYFCTFDYSAISEEPDSIFARRMTTDWGVAAIPVSAFHTLPDAQPGRVVRLCFAKTEEVLLAAAERIRESCL